MRMQLAALAALGLLAGAARAEIPATTVDLYYVPVAKIEAAIRGVGSGGDHGDGFGARARVSALDWLAVTAEYQVTGYQDFDDLGQSRVGVGYVGESGSGLFVEALDIDDALKATGAAAHARLAGEWVYVQVGYVWLHADDFEDDVKGYEFTIGAVIPVTERFKGFVDIRRTGLGHDGSEFEAELSDLRAGVRISFGGASAEPAAESEAAQVVEPAEEPAPGKEKGPALRGLLV